MDRYSSRTNVLSLGTHPGKSRSCLKGWCMRAKHVHIELLDSVMVPMCFPKSPWSPLVTCLWFYGLGGERISGQLPGRCPARRKRGLWGGAFWVRIPYAHSRGLRDRAGPPKPASPPPPPPPAATTSLAPSDFTALLPSRACPGAGDRGRPATPRRGPRSRIR